MLRLLQKTGIVTIEETVKNIPTHELVAWVDAQFQEQLSQPSLQEEAARYIRQLQDTKLLLERHLETARKKNARSELLPYAHQFISRISLPDPITVPTVLKVHAALELEVEKLSLAQEEFPDEFSAVQNSFRTTIVSENSITNGIKSSTPESSPGSVALAPLLLGIQAVHDAFSERLAKSGLQTMKTVLQKAAAIEHFHDTLLQLEQEVQRRTERVNSIHAKKEEKDAELRLLQQHPRYFRLEAIADERKRLLNELQAAASLTERFALKEKIDQLEKSVGDKDFIVKIEEAGYRADHFTQQDEKLQQELYELNDAFEELKAKRTREIELFVNLVMMSMGKKIQVTL